MAVIGAPGGKKEKDMSEMLKANLNGFLINRFNYLVWGLAVIIFGTGLWLFAYPNYKKVDQENRAARENMQTEYDKKGQYLSVLLNLKNSYQLIETQDISKIKAMIPSNQDAGGIISEIELIALKNGVILKSVRISQEAARSSAQASDEAAAGSKPSESAALPAGVSRLKIEVSLSSLNYPILKNIIKTFENSLRLFDVSKVDYDASGGKAALTVYSYYLN